eukprot:m.72201 g.72201  ORF g.72201 m.72201 type:complete len:349 (+) comp8768_c0_seq1:93-1139(+)
MGCCGSKPDASEQEGGVAGGGGGYSWDKREEVDPKNFTVKGLKKESVARAPGSLDGSTFVIADCHDADIYVFDHMASVTVDDCVNCTIFLGPIKGSVFVRDCTNCRVVVACQQFRTRDCVDCDVLLHVGSVPIIESTKGITFGCFRGSYFQLTKQFKSAELSPYNNYWHQIHDFTKSADGLNYTLSGPTPPWLEPFLERRPPDVTNVQVDVDPFNATVPITAGPTVASDDRALALTLSSKDAKALVRAAVGESGQGGQSSNNTVLLSTNEVKLSESDVERLVTSPTASDFKQEALSTPVIGLVFSGTNEQLATTVSSLKGTTVHIETDASRAGQELDTWTSITAARTD